MKVISNHYFYRIMQSTNYPIDISKWQTASLDLVPIGKRIKRVVVKPGTEQLYYFKEPKEKYPWEFWSEVISYQVGVHFNFNVLSYEPAILNGKAGCLSPSMISKNEELIHGQQYLTQVLPSFETKKGGDHSFLLIKNVFQKNENLQALLDDFIRMLVFDSVIGNRDRHQQNWAIIRGMQIDFEKFVLNARVFKQDITLPKLIWQLTTAVFSKQKLKSLGELKVNVNEYFKLSPYFDNGNCLAYNIIEENVKDLMKNDNKLDGYLFGSKATSHIKWDKEAITHIELLKNISQDFNSTVIDRVNKLKESYNQRNIEKIVTDIDMNFEKSNNKYILTTERKELICKLLQRRIERLFQTF